MSLWDTHFRRGFGLAPAAIAAAILVVAGLAIVAFNEYAYNQQAEREASVQAQIMSASVAPSLMFLDDASAQSYLNALAANPAIAAAAVYDTSGRKVAEYLRGGEAAAPQSPTIQSARFERGAIVAVTPVQAEGQPYGAVYLRSDAQTGLERVAKYAGLGVLILLACLVLVVFGLAQAALKRANLELERRADQLQQEIHQRERAEEELLQSRKMEAIGQLVGGVAHDFNNLLTVVQSGLRLMERHADPQRRATTVEAMRQAVERGAGLTRQLLAFARRQTLKPEVVNIGARLISMRELLERSLRADILVDIHVAADLWRVKSDPTQLELAILNLAVNARDAMPKGGVLTIIAENAVDASGEHVAIKVKDTGLGMSEDVRRRVFEPYFTTKQAGQGTGLGLAQVYGIVTQTGGNVRVESVVGEGTIVTLTLPRSLEAEAIVQAQAAPSAGRILKGKRLLVVEDDDAVAGVVADIAQDAGCSVHRVANAADALKVIAEPDRFDLMFSDVIMPGEMNGLDLAREVKSRLPSLPIVLTTGYSGAADVGGEFPVLRKPYQPEEFERLLEVVLAERAAKVA